MATEFKLPDLGEGVEAGDVVSVLVSEGDTVEKEQGVVELETDKALIEVPCEISGTITKIHVSAGDRVPVGATLITVEEAGDSVESTPAEAETEEPVKTPEETPAVQPSEPEKKAEPKAETPAPAAPPPVAGDPIPAAPATR
ncbi:MAG: biotin/lipoyl-containing protein, partial [Candidatus Latescibacterota bacterium]